MSNSQRSSSTGCVRASFAVIDVFSLLDEVRAIAQTGLHYAENPFDIERYERLLTLAANEYAERTALEPAEVRARFDAEVGHQSARIGADAAVFDAHDRILLVRRVDDDKWGLVAGWVDPNEGPAEAVVRELREEAGLDARVDALVGTFFRPAQSGVHPHGTVAVVFLCSIIGGTLRAQAHEVRELAYRAVDDVRDDEWHMHHQRLARAAREAHWRRCAGV